MQMKLFRVGLVAAAALGATLTGVGAQVGDAGPLPSANEILARHLAAFGGATAFKAVRSIRARGRLVITGPGVAGDFDLFAARPNRLLYRVTVSGVGVIEHAFDGKVGWTIDPLSGPEVLTGRQLQESADDAWFDHVLYEADHIRSFTPIERVEFDGRPSVKVRVTLRSGTDQFEFFDAASGLNIGVEAERLTPQGVVPTVSILRDLRRFGPVMLPAVLIQRALGVEQVVTISTYEFDTVEESAFTQPPAIAALVGR